MRPAEEILKEAIAKGASDIFVVAGTAVSMRVNDQLVFSDDNTIMMPEDTRHFVSELYSLAGNSESIDRVLTSGDDDFAVSIRDVSRFRCNIYKQRGSLSAVIRAIPFTLPTPEKMHIPQQIISFAHLNKGMVLVTGPAGSGKSTTLACIIDEINRTESDHIVTLEDPIEFLHRHEKSIVSQREISLDTDSYITALRAALRQSPDVILLGEMRDYETISVAMTAAETGHLLFSSLHTLGASNTINRIIDVFPAEQQRQIAIQLSTVLSAVVSQQLVPTVDGKIVPAFEIMTVTPAIRNMIRDNKVYQIDGVIYSSSDDSMFTMDDSLLKLYNEGTISRQTALGYAVNPTMLAKKIH